MRPEDIESLERAIAEAERLDDAGAVAGGCASGGAANGGSLSAFLEPLLAQDVAKARDSLDQWRLQVGPSRGYKQAQSEVTGRPKRMAR